MSDDIRKFLSQSGSSDPVFRFKSVGDEICGKIAEEPKLLPQKKYQSDEPKLDDDGNPVMELLLVLDTEQGRCRVYVDRPLQKSALWRAVDNQFSDSPAVGGTVWMKRVEDVRCQNVVSRTVSRPITRRRRTSPTTRQSVLAHSNSMATRR